MQKLGIEINYRQAGQGLVFLDAAEFLGYANHVRDTQLEMYAGDVGEEPEVTILEFILYKKHQAIRLYNDLVEDSTVVEKDEQKHHTDLNTPEYTIRLIHSWEKEQD